MFPGLKNFIFDLDGTLIDSSAGVIESTNYALKRAGYDLRPPEEIKRFIGHPLDEMFSAFCGDNIGQLKASFHEKSADVMVALTKELPGVSDLLPLIQKARYGMAIATTKYSANTQGIVEKFGWQDYFDVTVSGDQVSRVKPDPELIYLALRKLDCRAQEAVVVGDTINDILAAKDAGTPVIAVKSPFGNFDLKKHKPDLIIDKVSDLIQLFELK